MYESARTPVKPRDIRRRAYALMRQCWLTLLIASVLMSMLPWVKTAVEAHGQRLAREAASAATAAYLAEHPVTDDRADSIGYMAYRRAEDAYDDALRPWELLANGIDFLDTLFSGIIAVGLCHGLLNALRSGESTPHCLMQGWSRASTACWMAVQTLLRVLGWMLLPMLVSLSLSYVLGDWFEIPGTLLIVAVGLWASLHYALAEVHLADDADRIHTARECLRMAVDDADAFGVWQMCKVLWPMALPFALHVTVTTAAAFVPVLDIPALVLQVLCTLLILALEYACFVCIYDEMRQRIRAAEEAVPPNEGLARARALAANDE